MANTYIKRCSTLLVIKSKHIKTITEDIPTSMAKTKKHKNAEYERNQNSHPLLQGV